MPRIQRFYRLPITRPHSTDRWPLHMLAHEIRVHGEVPSSFLHELETTRYQVVLYRVVHGSITLEQIQEFICHQPNLDFPMAWEVLHFTNCLIKLWELEQRKLHPQRRPLWPQQQEEDVQLSEIMARASGKFDWQRFYAVCSIGHDILGVTPSGAAAGVVALHALRNPPREINCFMALREP